jgi:hypothetical protein
LSTQDENPGAFEDNLHPLRVGDEVRRQVAAVELHSLDDLEGGLEALGLLDGDDAVLADLLHGVFEDGPDLGIVVGRDRGDLRDRITGDRHGLSDDGCDRRLDGEVDAPLEVHRVGAGGDVLHSLAKDGLRQHRRCGCPVTGDVRGLRRDLAHHLGAHVLQPVSDLDLFGDGHTVLGDGW